MEAKATIKNRFTFEVEHIDTGKVETYKAENIVLDQCFTRLVNFQTYFTHIHVGTGTGTLDPTRTALFAPIASAAAKKSAETVLQERALPTSRWQRRVVIDPEELVGEELTEVGIGHSATNTNLCTHALIEDSEGNPISLVKTDIMVVTIYADVFFELGAIDAMYGGKWRWVHPLANNQLLSYLLGSSYVTQQFRVSAAPDFSDGTAPGSHGQSSNIATGDWTKYAATKKVVTPVRRLGISTGNGEVRCFGLGSSNTSGTFRGQFPITTVFTSHAIDEQVGVGDGAETGFNLSWNDPSSLVIKKDTVVVDGGDYTALEEKKGTNLFYFKTVEVVDGSPTNVQAVTDGHPVNDSLFRCGMEPDDSVGIDIGEERTISQIRLLQYSGSGSRLFELRVSDNADYSNSDLVDSFGSTSGVWLTRDFTETTSRYWILKATGDFSRNVAQLEGFSTDDQITFTTPPANGEIITAEYNVDYIPKDSDHALDLQCAIQYGEGS